MSHEIDNFDRQCRAGQTRYKKVAYKVTMYKAETKFMIINKSMFSIFSTKVNNLFTAKLNKNFKTFIHTHIYNYFTTFSTIKRLHMYLN